MPMRFSHSARGSASNCPMRTGETWASSMVSRLSVVRHCWFLAAVATLLINDHILKDAYGNWVTGKLSDFAGVVIVATLAWVVSGTARASCFGTAALFTAMKLSPEAAALASPFLGGGLIRTDPTDLIALLALVPTLCELNWQANWRNPEPQAQIEAQRHTKTGSCEHDRTTEQSRKLSTALIAGAALVACTATSLPQASGIDLLWADETGKVFVGSGDNAMTVSTDGGITFTTDPARTQVPRGIENTDSGKEHCDSKGLCFRVVVGERVERREGSSPWTLEFAHTSQELKRLDERLDGYQSDYTIFEALVVVERRDGTHVIVDSGVNGLMHRAPSGKWTLGDDLLTDYRFPFRYFRVLPFIVFLLSIFLRRPHHQGGWAPMAFALFSSGGLCLFMILAGLAGGTWESSQGAGKTALVGTGLIVLVASVVWLLLRPKNLGQPLHE
jgi:hypothetical protein